MDSTPPLVQSPASSPKTYCPSEASSSEYSSPGLVEQHYKLSFAYDTGSTCSTTPSLSSKCHSPRLEAITQADWSPASVLHPSLRTASMTSILSADFDVFAPYDGSCSTNVISGRGHSPPVSRSPIPTMRASLQYPPISTPSRPGTPRLKLEDLSSDYGHSLGSSHYPSPGMGNESYLQEVPSHPLLPPLEPRQHAATSYTSEGMLASWPRITEYPSELGLRFSGASIQPSLVLSVKRCPPRASQERPRRSPRKLRRLTTKEEANFQCDVKGCGKFFSRSYNFKAHMETHREKRDYPFPCQSEKCSRRFVRKTDLQRHTQSVHMKERNHECDYCGRMFARKDTLKRHKSDGCHRRFDLGTMDLRAEDQAHRELAASPDLPPLGIPPLSAHNSVVPPSRERERGENDPSWSR
ncbi:unnamed protein product [Discula destructiva]